MNIVLIAGIDFQHEYPILTLDLKFYQLELDIYFNLLDLYGLNIYYFHIYMLQKKLRLTNSGEYPSFNNV